MNKRQKQVLKSLYKNEVQVLMNLENAYEEAIQEIDKVILQLLGRTDVQNTRSIIYQIKYQEQLKKELTEILDVLHKGNYKTIDDFLHDCYNHGHIGTLFDLQGQGVPLLIPLDQEQVISAVVTNSKLSAPLYNALGFNVESLKIDITREISRGIAQSLSYEKIAGSLRRVTGVDYNKSLRIAKTEGHRIQNEAAYNVQQKAKTRGASIVKQWDATLDGKTRDTHRMLDGQTVEVDEYFTSDSGAKALYPGNFGMASEDCNCRCALLQRAKWALTDEEFTKMNGETDELQHFESVSDYNQFKELFWAKDKI